MDKDIRVLLEQIKKLESEGFLKFNQSRSEVMDFIENDMEYVVFGKEESVTKYSSCREACGMSLYQLNKFVDKELKSDSEEANKDYSHEERVLMHKYCMENNLRDTWFNLVTWKKLGIIFLNNSDYDVIKFHKKKAKEELI